MFTSDNPEPSFPAVTQSQIDSLDLSISSLESLFKQSQEYGSTNLVAPLSKLVEIPSNISLHSLQNTLSSLESVISKLEKTPKITLSDFVPPSERQDLGNETDSSSSPSDNTNSGSYDESSETDSHDL